MCVLSGLKKNIRDVGRFGCSRFEVKFRQPVAQIDFFSELREAHRYNALVDFDRGELFDDGSQQGVTHLTAGQEATILGKK